MRAVGFVSVAAMAAFLASCGGDDGPSIIGGGGGATPPTTVNQCALSERQAFARQVIETNYLFPDQLNLSANPASYNDLQSYIDALVAPARANDVDRGFTYVTDASEEDALINSGSNAGFGIRLSYDTANSRVTILEAFENAPAFQQGIDRGTQLIGIGTSTSSIVPVADLFAQGGAFAVSDALGPSDPGVSRALEILIAGESTTRIVTVTKAEYALDPISDRYGALTLNDNGKNVGYINLRTFIVQNANTQLRDAFANFKAQGVDEVIIDLRYNGGGLVNVAETFGNLMSVGLDGQDFFEFQFRPSRAAENFQITFDTLPEAIRPAKIAFIGFGGSASASELLINSFVPYYGTNMALIGGNTYGKPVGQEAFDRGIAACDDRLRVVTFRTVNADNQGDYFSGLATTVPVTCRASDNPAFPLGDVREPSIAQSLDFLAGRGTCTAIAQSGAQGAQSLPSRQELIQGDIRDMSAAQRRIPGIF